ncbi:MAG: hypothetical protein EU521_00060 [Promethearchaeota archaeon]|nr:MAG: hypothetical protein EU521_00060 [Candidatus Lokiarchaeota archaeon]
MIINIFLIGLAFFFGITFFLAHYYEKKHPILHTSLIAGISVAYFFMVVLPEISERIPEYPLHQTFLEFFFVFIGFSFIHVSEKLILQRVERKNQEKLRKLIRMENTLEAVEDNIENIVNEELMHEELDKFALKDMGSVLESLHTQGRDIKKSINQTKIRIHDKINEDLEQLRFFTNFLYHFLVGIILFNLLFVDFLSAIFFYLYAFFRTIISNRLIRSHILFTDLDIKIDYDESIKRKILLSSAALMGMFLDFLLDFIYPINLEILYILFSFISGVILYTIVREIIPEKEKGNPLYFIMGAVGFTIAILIINIFVSIV